MSIEAFRLWRFKGDVKGTILKLNKAFNYCKKRDNLLIKTVMLEYSAYFYESIGYRKSAESNMKAAYNAFSDWGALEKLKMLRVHYPEYLSHEIIKT